MNNIDRQRVSAVRVLEGLGYTFVAGEWKAPDGAAQSLVPIADGMLACPIRRACS
jgi:hypothetical protein